MENYFLLFLIDIYKFLTSYLKKAYAIKAKLYLCKNYSKLIKNDEIFLNIEFELLISLLMDECLFVNSEFEVLESVVKWLLFDYEMRREYVKELLDLIRPSNLKSLKLYDYLNSIQCEDLKIKIGNYLYEKFEIHHSIGVDESRKYLRKSILIFGGVINTANNKLNNKVYCFDTVKLKIFPILNSFLTRSNHCVSELNDLLFIAGGEVDLAISDLVQIFDLDYFRKLINDYYSNNLPDYDSIESDDDNNSQYQNEILNNCQHMLQARTDFGLCSIDDKLFVFGGWIGSDVGDKVECFSAFENRWFIISSLPTLRYEFACIALSNSSFIYLIGGKNSFETKLSLVSSRVNQCTKNVLGVLVPY